MGGLNNHFLAKFGTDAHRAKLIDHEDPDVRAVVALHGTDEQRDKLSNDPHAAVGYALAIRGEKKHLDKLVHHPAARVITAVVQHGHKDHMKIAAKRKDGGWYQQYVAKHGDTEDRDNIMKNPIKGREAMREIAKHNHKPHLDALVNSEDWITRGHVAKHGHEDHHAVLMHDQNENVRASVAGHTTRERAMHMLNNDPHFLVREHAKMGLKKLDNPVNESLINRVKRQINEG